MTGNVKVGYWGRTRGCPDGILTDDVDELGGFNDVFRGTNAGFETRVSVVGADTSDTVMSPWPSLSRSSGVEGWKTPFA